jgi:hypothetical protein
MNPDFLDLLRSLLAADVRFMVVGAYAVGVHGRPRATKDLDVWVEPSVENAPKVIKALLDFGAPLMGLTARDLETPGVGLQVGMEPLRIDLLTKISGPQFSEAWPAHIEAQFAPDVRCPVIGLDSLLANKRAAGRPQDLADVAALEKLAKLPKPP